MVKQGKIYVLLLSMYYHNNVSMSIYFHCSLSLSLSPLSLSGGPSRVPGHKAIIDRCCEIVAKSVKGVFRKHSGEYGGNQSNDSKQDALLIPWFYGIEQRPDDEQTNDYSQGRRYEHTTSQ